MAMDLSTLGLFLGAAITLTMIGLAEKKFWPLGAAGGLLMIALAGVLAQDQTLNVAYQSTGTPITYTLPPLVTFVFGAIGFLVFVLTAAEGNDIKLTGRW